ncbi:MAG: AAA family ATPase [Aestuariivita sp.]|nr:AAA family ATPase [Aestuariivita sp.]MCY4345371.1 AAA family ATPase [Aestuariivita sp.]
MASPHHNVTVVTKGKGHDAVRAAAYRHATKMQKEDGRLTNDYGGKKNELIHSEIALPPDAAQWIQNLIGEAAFKKVYEEIRTEFGQSDNDAARFPVTAGVASSSNVIAFPRQLNGSAEGPDGGHEGQQGAEHTPELTEEKIEREAWARLSERLWRSVTQAENRLNKFPNKAQLARSVTIALPKVLKREHQIEAVRSFITGAYTQNGMVADWVLHDKGDGNPHVHIMLTLREVGDTDWSRRKTTEWNKVSLLREWRQLWAQQLNLILEREGFEDRVDHRSLEAIQVDLGLEPRLIARNQNIHISDYAELMGDQQRELERLETVDRHNQSVLRESPEYILTWVQSQKATFTRQDLYDQFVKQLRLDRYEDAYELLQLTDAALALPQVISTIVQGERRYITRAKARQVGQVSKDAKRLAQASLGALLDPENLTGDAVLRQLAPAKPQGEDSEGTANKNVAIATDGIETGTGPIIIDVATYIDLAELTTANATEAVTKGKQLDEARERLQARKEKTAALRQRQLERKGPSVEIIREALNQRAEELFEQAFGEPQRRAGAEWRAKQSSAIAMQIRGPNRGKWYDHSAGEGGDLIDLVAKKLLGHSDTRQNFPKVMQEAAAICGIRAEAFAPDAAVLERLEDERSAREKEAVIDEARKRLRREALVKYIRSHAVRLSFEAGEGAPPLSKAAQASRAYLSARSIKELPSKGLAALGRTPRSDAPSGLLNANYDSLIVWAYNAEGKVTGGQRILTQGDGQKAEVEVRKPSFGEIAGSVARFAATKSDGQKGPLVIAEGPESALSIWQATGLETWAVFGVSNWKSAPIPLDREVILAPDRDAPRSPAGRAFRKAVAHHVARGCNLKIAVAPEPTGSKRDLNDTAMRAGKEAVQEAIAQARVVKPWLSPTLNEGQRRAAEAMLSPERLTMVMGYAGTGKTYTLTEVSQLWQERGFTVLAGAPSGKATQALATIPGIEAASLAGWESRWARGQTPEREKFVFIMDEAGMVGSSQWARIQSFVGSLGGKLIAVGDPEQLQPVMEISGWRRAEREVRKLGAEIPVMSVVQRQRDAADREATVALAEGHQEGIRFALDHYERKGAFVFNATDPITEIAKALVQGSEDGGTIDLAQRIALAATHGDVKALNDAILHAAGEAGLVDRKNARIWPVETIDRSVDSDELEVLTRVYDDVEVGVGGRIMLTQPHHQYDLPRSSFGTVTAVEDSRFCLRMDGDGRAVWINPEQFRYFAPGFAATVHKAQGMTVDQAFVLAHRTMDRHGLNVALTRHRDQVRLYGQKDHCEGFEELYKLATRRQWEPRFNTGRGDSPVVPLPDADVVLGRADWTGRQSPLPKGSLLADRQLMSVATRVAGLLGADHAENDPIFAEVTDGSNDYREYPTRVIDDLVARQGVVTAEEVAGALARQVKDPVTFLRLFSEAIAHPELVHLPRADGRAGDYDVRVFTTRAQLQTELAAVDRGLRLALRSVAPGEAIPAPTFDMLALANLDATQQQVLRDLYEPSAVGGGGSGLAIVEGGAGSGKTRLAAVVAQTEREAGRGVVVITSSEASRQALLAEGVDSVTITEHLRSIPAMSASTKNRLVIVDDANSLSAAYAELLLSRLETDGDRLVAFINPDRRPRRAGPTFQRLSERMQLAAEDGDIVGMVANLTAVHGVKADDLHALRVGLRGGTETVEAALQTAIEQGAIALVNNSEQALEDAAIAYVNDPAEDKLALGWSGRDRDALTDAIRAALDATVPARQSDHVIKTGDCKGLKVGDRVRFTASGLAGPAGGDADTDDLRLHRGDLATVLAVTPDTLTLRVSDAQGKAGREVTVPSDGPLPRWTFAFASTIMATSGRRHGSIHLFGSVGLDRVTLEAAAASASDAFQMVLPVDDGKEARVINNLASRRRDARSVVDYGFDAYQTIEMAREAVAAEPYIAALELDDRNPTPADDLTAELEATALPTVGLGALEVVKANEAYVRANPEHVLTVLATDRAVFTEVDVRQALREHGGRQWSETDIKKTASRIIKSSSLIKLSRPAPDGAAQYITPGRAAQLAAVGVGAGKLIEATFAPGTAAVVRPDALEQLNESQTLAAEAMLSDRRLTLITGRAGTGKTFTLKAVAEEWEARGVKVLAGAPSGKATAELRGTHAIEAETLASWEARWARNEVPTEPFVFIMDEAGMVGVGQWGRIQEKVLALGGKLIAVGDPNQLQPVADLPGWEIAERAAGGSVEIGEVLRQRQPSHKIATQNLARGGTGITLALAIYDANFNAVKLDAETIANPITTLARQYVDAELDEGADATSRTRLALAFSNRDVAELNDAIRAMRLTAAIKAKEVQEAAQGGQDDNIILPIDAATQRQYGLIQRRYVNQDGEPEVHATPRLLAVGDRVMTTAALRVKGIAKSSFGTVVKTGEDEIAVRFDGRKRSMKLDRDMIAALDYGYASTIHKSQGLSADDVYLLTHRRMHRHATYVAMSRHRDNLTIYGRIGHVEDMAQLTRRAQASGHLDMDPEELARLGDANGQPAATANSMVMDHLTDRDWPARLDATTPPDPHGAIIGDPDVLKVVERQVGLIQKDYAPDQPPIKTDLAPALARYVDAPQRVIDDLISRRSVIRANDIAEQLARVVNDPTTFVRMFSQAMAHPDLIRLGKPDAKGDHVFTTKQQLSADARAVDIGVQLALHGHAKGAPTGDLDAAMRSDWRLKMRVDHSDRAEDRALLAMAMAPNRLRLIRGEAGAGKTHMASELATAHAAVGWDVVTLAPTGAGLTSLERAGVTQPMTVRRFLERTETHDPSGDSISVDPLELTSKSVVIVDDATLLDGAAATALLERIAHSGAKLIGMLGGKEQVPLRAGAVMRDLEMRLGALDLGADRARDAKQAAVLRQLLRGGRDAALAIGFLENTGSLVAGVSARQAIGVLADAYVNDASDDKMALVWSRADMQAVTKAIRIRLDQQRSERRAAPSPQRDAKVKALKLGDRIRFTSSTAWTPGLLKDKARQARRVLVGEHAEVVAVNHKTGGFILEVTGRDGESKRRLNMLPQHQSAMADWEFDFASTIHSQGAKLHSSVHLLASRGMSRQVLAVGVAVHKDKISIVVPAAAERMAQLLNRVCRRDTRAESALDYGFDPTLAARAAMQSHEPLLDTIRENTAPAKQDTSGFDTILDQLARVAGVKRSHDNQALPAGVAANALGEVVGATLHWEQNSSRPVSIAERRTAEELIAAIADRKQWRSLLHKLPANFPTAAGALARSQMPSHSTAAEVKTDSVARYLARGALAARHLGEKSVAEIFELALSSYSVRTENAVRAGHSITAGADNIPRLSARADILDRERRDEPLETKTPRQSAPTLKPELKAAVKQEATAAKQPAKSAKKPPKPKKLPRENFNLLALQLAVAISERIDAYDGVHRRDDLVKNIRTLLERAAGADLPRDSVVARCRAITEARITYEAKRDFARALRSGIGRNFDEDFFAAALTGRSSFYHPLQFSPRTLKDAYDEGAETRVRTALANGPKPSHEEIKVACVTALPDLSPQDRDLAEALAKVFAEGSLRAADEIKAEREAILKDLRQHALSKEEDKTLLTRIFSVFTQREIGALANPTSDCPTSLEVVPMEDRARLFANVAKAAKETELIGTGHAWSAAAKYVCNRMVPERARAKEGEGMSL